MSERKINLEEILNKHLASRTSLEVDYDDYVFIKRAMFEACHQVLELAAENADGDIVDDSNYSRGKVVIDKDSIINTINQVE